MDPELIVFETMIPIQRQETQLFSKRDLLSLIESLRLEFPNCKDLDVPTCADQWSSQDLKLYFASCGEIKPPSIADMRRAEAAWSVKLERDREVRAWRACERAGLKAWRQKAAGSENNKLDEWQLIERVARRRRHDLASGLAARARIREALYVRREACEASALALQVIADAAVSTAWLALGGARRALADLPHEAAPAAQWTDGLHRGEWTDAAARVVSGTSGVVVWIDGCVRPLSDVESPGVAAAVRRQSEGVEARLELAAKLGSETAATHASRGGWLAVCRLKRGVALVKCRRRELHPKPSTFSFAKLPRVVFAQVIAFCGSPADLVAIENLCRASAAAVLADDELWASLISANAKPLPPYFAGYREVVAASTARIAAWGAGAAGQLGLGNLADRAAPRRIVDAMLKSIVVIAAAGDTSACACRDGSVWAWGRLYEDDQGGHNPMRLEPDDAVPTEPPTELEIIACIGRPYFTRMRFAPRAGRRQHVLVLASYSSKTIVFQPKTEQPTSLDDLDVDDAVSLYTAQPPHFDWLRIQAQAARANEALTTVEQSAAFAETGVSAVVDSLGQLSSVSTGKRGLPTPLARLLEEDAFAIEPRARAAIARLGLPRDALQSGVLPTLRSLCFNPILPKRKVLQIAAGRDFFFALTDAATVYAFDERAKPKNDSQPLVGLRHCVWIGAGDTFAAALDDDGILFAWGSDATVLSQSKVTAPWPVWPLASSRVLAAACGRAHILVLFLPRHCDPRQPSSLLPQAPRFFRAGSLVPRGHFLLDGLQRVA